MRVCENCESEHDGTYASGRFCSQKCSRCFSTKEKRKSINEKVSKTLTGSGNGDVELICKNCNSKFKVNWRKRKQTTCSVVCGSKNRFTNEYRFSLSSKLKAHYSIPENRNRLRDIGRKGGFGTKGFTKFGKRYESLLEKICYEYLEEMTINFEVHKQIPNSSKVSDIYLNDVDIWIEIDGINREKKQKWLSNEYQYWLEELKNLIGDINQNILEK